MASSPGNAPLLAQVPAAQLARHLGAGVPGGRAQPSEVGRRTRWGRVGRRIVTVLFLGLAVMSTLALGKAAAAATTDGLDGDDLAVLAMLVLISGVVVSQTFALSRALPGARRIWVWVARFRARRAGPMTGRPLLAQADARVLLRRMPPATRRGAGGTLRSVAATAGWVGLTLVIMAGAMAGAFFAVRSAVRSIATHGWGLASVLGLGMAGLVAYGVTVLSVGLIRSWFERRRRRLRRMLARLLRYLLRGFHRSAAALRRALRQYDGGTGLAGRAVLIIGGAALMAAASFRIPAGAAGGAATDAGNSETAVGATSTTVMAAGVLDDEDTPGATTGGETSGEEGEDGAVSGPAPVETGGTMGLDAATLAEATTTTEGSTTTEATTTTLRAVVDTATTAMSTTLSTTTVPPDTTGPTVGGVSARPTMIFTSGNDPDASLISATASDPSGVASMTVHYRRGAKAGFSVWTTVAEGSLSTTFGPFDTLGAYEYRIVATDTLGNASCKSPAACPGGTVIVTIP
jgi:hypothetical protein